MIEICPHISQMPWEKPWGIWKKRTKNAWLKRIWRRVYRRNQNWLCIGYGGTGTGKSYSSISLCNMLDPDFCIDNIVFDAMQLLELIEAGKVKQGSAVLFEELGVAANARGWHTVENQSLSNITQVFRTLNLIVIYTVPRLGLVDKQVAPLAHAHFQACGIDWKNHENVALIYDPVSYNEQKNKWYLQHPKFKLVKKENGRVWMETVKMRKLRLRKAPAKLCNAYEKKRKAYELALRQKAWSDISQSRQMQKRSILTDERLGTIVDEIVRNKEKYVVLNDTKFDRAAVMRDFEVGGANASRIKEAATRRFKELNFHVIYR